MAEETKISQAQIVKPVIKIEDNTGLISSQIEKVFARGVRSDGESIKLLTDIEQNTNKLLSLWGRPVERVRKNNQTLTQGQRPQTARARDDKGRFVAVAKPQERVKVNPLKSVFEPTSIIEKQQLIREVERSNQEEKKQGKEAVKSPAFTKNNLSGIKLTGSVLEPEDFYGGQNKEAGNAKTRSARSLEEARQKKSTKRQEGFFSKLLKKAGFFGKETVGAVGDVTDKTFFEKLAGPIYGTAKELREAGKEVWDSTKSIGERIGKAFGKKGNTDIRKNKEGRDEKGRFLAGSKTKQTQQSKKDTSLFKKMLGKLASSEQKALEKQKFDEEAAQEAERRQKELVKAISQNGGGESGGGGSFLSGFMKKGGLAGIIGTLTGGLGVGGMLTAGAGGLLTGAAGAIPAIVSAVLVALAGAAGYGIGKIVNGLIDRAMGEKGAIGSKLYDWVHGGNQKRQEEEGEAANIEYGGLGSVSAKYESGQGGAGTISSGQGDAGGKSYGTYQLSKNTGTLNKFLQSSPYGSQFQGLEPGSEAFDAKWKQIAANDPEFGRAQHNFIGQTHYQPAVKSLMDEGLDVEGRSRGVQEVVWSKANQYGAKGGASLIRNALKDKDVKSLSDEDLIKTVAQYERSRLPENFKSSSPKILGGLYKRIQEEEKTNLALTGSNSKVVTGKITMPGKEQAQAVKAQAVAPEAIKPQTIESPQSVTVAAQKATQDQIAKMTASLGDVTKNIDPKKWVSDKMDKNMGFDVNMVPSELDDVTLTLMRYDRL